MDKEKHFEIFKIVLQKQLSLKTPLTQDETIEMTAKVLDITDIVYDMYTTKDLNNEKEL